MILCQFAMIGRNPAAAADDDGVTINAVTIVEILWGPTQLM